MRFLMVHVDRFRSQITERGRSSVFEEARHRVVETDESILTLVSVEKRDEERVDEHVAEAAVAIVSHARQLKVSRVVLNPFAHLFGELAKPSVAVKAMKKLHQAIVDEGLDVSRVPFGWFNTLDIQAKGHPLSRVARSVPAG